MLVLPVILALSACRPNKAAVESPHSQSGLNASGAPYSSEEIAAAVRAGLVAKRWTISTDEPGAVTGTVTAGGHSATVRVVYDAQGWAIEYVGSSPGLVYENHPELGPLIHHRYNLWVSHLDNAIRGSLAAPPTATPAPAPGPTPEAAPPPTGEPANQELPTLADPAEPAPQP